MNTLVLETATLAEACSSCEPHNALTPSQESGAELKQELGRLMAEQIASLDWQSFMGIDDAELRRQEKRLNRIREVSAELILATRKPSP